MLTLNSLKIALLLVVLLIAMFWLLGFHALKKYGDSIYANMRAIGPRPVPDQDYQFLENNPRWHKDVFEVEPGIQLHGVVREPENPSPTSPWLLLYHANGRVEFSSFPQFVSDLLDEGWGFAVWTYRGYGPSDGISTKTSLRQDSVRMAERLQQQWHVDAAQVRIYGFSLGTAPATYAAMALSERGSPAAGVVLVATGYRPPFPSSLVYNPLTEVSIRDKITSPILMIHGRNDRSHLLENAVADFTALKKADADLLLVRAGHNPIGLDQVKDRVRKFLESPSSRM